MQDSNPRRRVRSPSGYPDYPNRPLSLGTHPLLQIVGRSRRLQWGHGRHHPASKKAAVSVVEIQRCLSLQPMCCELRRRRACTPISSAEKNQEFVFYSTIQRLQRACFWIQIQPIHKPPASAQYTNIVQLDAELIP